MLLSGSCRCGAVSFSIESHTPYPYQLCYCSICRKTAGGGGFAINLMGDAASLDVKGRGSIGIFHATLHEDGGPRVSSGARHYCKHCATALWLYDPTWPDLAHPFASAIDTDLPVPPWRVHLLLESKASWVEPDIRPGDEAYGGFPELSIEEWHRRNGLFVP